MSKNSNIKYAIILYGWDKSGDPETEKLGDGRSWHVIRDSEGWVPATTRSTFFDRHKEAIADLKLFDTKKAAQDFMKGWTPHPWFVGVHRYVVFPVKPVYRTVFDGYERIPNGKSEEANEG